MEESFGYQGWTYGSEVEKKLIFFGGLNFGLLRVKPHMSTFLGYFFANLRRD